MSTRGRKQRAWRTIRCVVEVKVPPSNRSTEKDLIYQVEQSLERGDGIAGLPMPRHHAADRYEARAKVKSFVRTLQQISRELAEKTLSRVKREWGIP